MKFSKFLMATFVLLFLFSVLVEGCTDDPTGPGHDPDLVGDWEIILMISEYDGMTDTLSQSEIDTTGFIWVFCIHEDGTMAQNTNISGPQIIMEGTWETNGDQLFMTLTGPSGGTSTLVYQYTCDGSLMTLRWALTAGTKFYAEFAKVE